MKKQKSERDRNRELKSLIGDSSAMKTEIDKMEILSQNNKLNNVQARQLVELKGHYRRAQLEAKKEAKNDQL